MPSVINSLKPWAVKLLRKVHKIPVYKSDIFIPERSTQDQNP